MKLIYKQHKKNTVVIPKDWEIKELGSIADFLDSSRKPIKDNDRLKIQGNIPYYGASGIVDYINDFLFDEDLILLGEDGENIINRNSRLAFKITGKSWVNNHAHVLRINQEVDINYLSEYLESLNYEQYNTGTAQPKLNKSTCLGIPVLLPPRVEQRAIATALNDMDALLESLKCLITKKRAIKQATMQQLLSGKTRLAGYTHPWKSVKLGDVTHIKTGSRNNEDKCSGGAYPFFVRSEFVERIDTYSHDCEAILVPGEGRIGDVYHYVNGKFDVHQRVYAITQFSADAHAKYVYLYMKNRFGSWALKNTVKATVDSLRLPTFQDFEIQLPSSIDEQKAIAAIINDEESEVEAMEAKLMKYQYLKQAMMQELLTGRTRLI